MYELGHFAIHCDDVGRAKQFYERVFAWTMSGYKGVSEADFQQIKTAEGKLLGAIESRKFNPAKERILGFECSISVPDVDATARAVEAAGGTILMRKSAIPGVGWIIKFFDTEGNLCCAVAQDRTAR
jgi:predicted enzyme related to lactoylglutathione lyase